MISTAREKMTVRLAIQVKKVLFFILLQEIMSATGVNAVEEPSVTSTSRSSVFVSRRNTRLVGHAIKWVYSPSLLSCSQLCLSKTWCASINFKMSSKKDTGKGTCELNKHNWPLIDEYGILQSQHGVIFALLLKVSSGCYFLNKLLFQLVKTGSNTFYLWFTLRANGHDFWFIPHSTVSVCSPLTRLYTLNLQFAIKNRPRGCPTASENIKMENMNNFKRLTRWLLSLYLFDDNVHDVHEWLDLWKRCW